MKSPFHKGQKLIWDGVTFEIPRWYSFPKQKIEVLSTDGRMGMTLIECQIHFNTKHGGNPKYRQKWVMDPELYKRKAESEASK